MIELHSAIAGRRGRAALRLVAIGGLAAMLAGCYTPRQEVNNYPQDYHQRHPITLREGERTVEVFISRNRGGLTPEQRADVLAFAQAWRREGNSAIVIDIPRGGAISRAASDTMREIQSIFNASAVPANAVSVRSYTPATSTLASIKLNYSRLTAHAGPCGLWPADLGPSFDPSYTDNRAYWNLGCASQRNLAAMVANPTDLVQPRGETPAYEGRRAVALDKWRKGEPPSGRYDNYDKSKISDVGK
jgi:pilus assembly protein CpaD